jgi:hypothetical protein
MFDHPRFPDNVKSGTKSGLVKVVIHRYFPVGTITLFGIIGQDKKSAPRWG